MHTTSQLQERIAKIKATFLQMYKSANAGHVGSSLSCAEILGVTWFYHKKESDKVILSKGHAAAALYATLHEAGILSDAAIESFYKNNTILPAHPPVNKIKEIPFATGSLGHGLSIAAGFGYSNKLQKNGNKVFCITSDGEINEGSTWEAALFIAHHALKDIVWIVDRNRFQGFGATEETIKLDPLDEKLKAFGFDVIEIDGHDIEQIVELESFIKLANKPVAVIANTIKGNGWERANTLASHYLPMKEQEYLQIINKIQHESRI